MQAGKLNKLIEIYAPSLSVNSFGEQIQIYEKVYETRAEIKRNSGNRNVENNEEVYNHTLQLRVRYYVEVCDNYQIKFDNKLYRILDIDCVNEWNEKRITVEKIND